MPFAKWNCSIATKTNFWGGDGAMAEFVSSKMSGIQQLLIYVSTLFWRYGWKFLEYDVLQKVGKSWRPDSFEWIKSLDFVFSTIYPKLEKIHRNYWKRQETLTSKLQSCWWTLFNYSPWQNAIFCSPAHGLIAKTANKCLWIGSDQQTM